MSREIDIKVSEHLPADSALLVRPGDILILRYSRQVDALTADKIHREVLQRLPGLGGVLVVAGAEQLGVYRPAVDTHPTPPYVHNLLTAFLDQSPLDFGANPVPPDVRARLRAAHKDGSLRGVPSD